MCIGLLGQNQIVTQMTYTICDDIMRSFPIATSFPIIKVHYFIAFMDVPQFYIERKQKKLISYALFLRSYSFDHHSDSPDQYPRAKFYA